MWKPCPKVIDEPIQILGLEWSDVVLMLSLFAVITVLFNPFAGIGGGMAFSCLLWWIKRDCAPGAIVHLLHRLELWPIAGVFAPVTQRFSPW